MIEVSGRLYPVEQRYRPIEEDEETGEAPDLAEAIVDAVDDLSRLSADGDILVFLPGEREIRETAEESAQTPSGAYRDPAAVRAALRAGAGAGVPARRRTPHRARHQRGRDLAHGAGNQVRHRLRPGARQPLQLSQQGRDAAGGAHLPRLGGSARRPLRSREQRGVRAPVQRGGLSRTARSLPTPRFCAPPLRRSSCA